MTGLQPYRRAVRRLSAVNVLHLAGVLAILLMAACSQVPEKSQSDVKPSFSEYAAGRTFTVGLQHIRERYIDDITVRDTAMAGLEGLTTIDPSLTVTASDGKLTVQDKNGLSVHANLPGDNDAETWAQLITRVTSEFRKSSPPMGRAGNERIVEAVFDAAVAKLDGISRYATALEARRNRASREGFGGVGLRFEMRRRVPVIVNVMPDGPAQKKGLVAGDRIVAINGRSTEGWLSREVVAALRGRKGTTIKLTIDRAGESNFIDVLIRRTHIVPESVIWEIRGDVLYVKIINFNRRTSRSVKTAVEHAQLDSSMPLKGIILDLRDNPGGLLDQAVEVSDQFLTKGEIVTTRGRHPDSLQMYSADEDQLAKGVPMVVLVNKGTASAAEIVAAALQDNDRAVVVGSATYGKGTVQTVLNMPNGGELTLTWSRFQTPWGYFLEELGVPPNVCTSADDGDAEALVQTALEKRRDFRVRMRFFRLALVDDHKDRKKLKEACPPREGEAEIDMQVAQRLMSDKSLYASAIAITHGGGSKASQSAEKQ